MRTQPEDQAGAPSPGQPAWRRILSRPSTRPGRWSVGLAGCFMGLFIIVSVLRIGMAIMEIWQPGKILYVIFLMLCGLAAALAGLAAVIRHGERSWLVWLSILLGLFMFSLILFEFLVPH